VGTGSLTVVGTGIDVGRQMTREARLAFEAAEEALCLVGDPIAFAVLQGVNPAVRSLHGHYVAGKKRLDSYEEMVEDMLAPVRAGKDTCVAFYGHPGFFVYPGHEAVRRAREEGFAARMLPGVSSVDTLFCDLGIDPGRDGCQLHHATDLLVCRTAPDTAAVLLLLQISVVGRSTHTEETDWSGLPVLVEYLTGFYPPEHEVIGYEASPFPVADPIVVRCRLDALADAPLTPGMTLVITPATARRSDPTMLDRLGMTPS
jgi:hypothetical protein